MKSDWPLTQKEVDTYRYLYYQVYKPLVKEGLEEGEVRQRMKSALASVDWTYRQFEEYKSIDFMQRLVFDYSHELVMSGHRKEPMTSTEEYRQYDPNYGALRLKDNDQSDDPDQKH